MRVLVVDRAVLWGEWVLSVSDLWAAGKGGEGGVSHTPVELLNWSRRCCGRGPLDMVAGLWGEFEGRRRLADMFVWYRLFAFSALLMTASTAFLTWVYGVVNGKVERQVHMNGHGGINGQAGKAGSGLDGTQRSGARRGGGVKAE